jgi:rod shape-determining protein MreC
MQIGTLDRTPPPFFRQGYSALTKLVFFSALAVFLMAADRRFAFVQPLRAAIATALQPAERMLQVPLEAWRGGRDYWRGLSEARRAERAALEKLALQSERAARADTLAAENRQLRALLDLKPALAVRSIAAEVLYEAADPYSRKLFIDRGATHGVAPGAPVINDAGVVGQATRVYPLTSEVTLLIDKDAAIPVLNTRTQLRAVAFGGASAAVPMELRFVPVNTDVRAGDLLVTSGVDGVYPPGLPVARVASVERPAEQGYARIVLTPAAPIEGARHLLVLEPLALQMPPRPDTPAPAARAAAAAKGAP